MKKMISIFLVCMMLVSVVAINVSAAPVASYETVNIYTLNEDYQEDGDSLNVMQGFFEIIPEEGNAENYVLDAKGSDGGTTTAGVLYAEDIGLENIEDFVVEFDVLPIFASAPISVGFNHPVYGNYGIMLFPGSFSKLSLRNPDAAYGVSNPAWVESEDVLKGADKCSVRITVDRNIIDGLSKYEGYYFNYPKAVDENNKEIAIEAWGATAGTVNSIATQTVAKALKVEIDKGDGYVAVDSVNASSSYSYANIPRVQVGTGITPAAVSGSELCIKVMPATTWYETVFVSTFEGEGEEATEKLVSIGPKTHYQLDNIKVYYEAEQLADVTDGTIVAQDYEDVANNTAGTKRENYGTVEVKTEDGNSYIEFTSTKGGNFYQGYTTLINNSDFGKYDWEISMDIMRKSGNNAIGFNVYGYNEDFVNKLTTNTDTTENCVMIPSSEFNANTWYRIKATADPIISSDGKTTYASIKVMKKNLSVENSEWEVTNRVFYQGNPSNASGKFIIQMTADVAKRVVDISDGRLNPVGTAPAASETNDVAVYCIDNVKLTYDETIKVEDIATDGSNASAKVKFGNASRYLTEDTYNVMMVSYDDENRVVGVDMQTATPVAGVVEDVELSVEKTDDVKVYVWETSTGTPLLGDIFDLSAWL